MIGLETERLLFRKWDNSDFPNFSKFYQDENAAKYVGGVKSPEESWRLMATYLGHYELNGFSYLALETKESKTLVGTVGLWKSSPWPEPELGYWILLESQGKGFAFEAGVAVRKYAREIDLPSLVSYIDPANEPSKKLAMRLGAQRTDTIDLLGFGPHEVYRYW